MVDGNIILSVAKAMELLQILSQAGRPLLLKQERNRPMKKLLICLTLLCCSLLVFSATTPAQLSGRVSS